MDKITAFKMKLKTGCLVEYKKRHDEIWPELKEMISQSGVYDYSIFLDEETHILFAVHKVKGDRAANDLGGELIVQKWWAYMADIMETNPDHSPITTVLTPVFYMA